MSCSNLIRGNVRLCPECQVYEKASVREYDQERLQDDPGRRFWLSSAGRKIRETKLHGDPLCERHLKNDQVVVAVLVHHRDGNELNNTDENLESLCNPCHEKIHGPNRFKRKIQNHPQYGG